jgi:endonuclease YncB( thermonuclease family)
VSIAGRLLERSLEAPPGVFAATVVSVHDGDTFTADVRLPVTCYGADRAVGFGLAVAAHHLWLRARIRLAGCNARELSEPGGREAAAHLAEVLTVGLVVECSRVRADDYGNRWDAAVAVAVNGRADLVTELIADGWAAPWNGRGARPVPPWPRID